MFTGELFDYQYEDCVKLSSRNCALNALACGLGKTVEMIAICEYLLDTGKVDTVLVFCRYPHEWVRQIAKFTDKSPDDILNYSGTPAKRKELREKKPVYIATSYGLSLREDDIQYFRKKCGKHTVLIADEVHRIKDRSSRRAIALQGLSQICKYRYALSATPVWNKLDDLFGIMQWVNKDVLGSWAAFKENYLIMSFHKIIAYKNLPELKKILKPYIIRRTADSVKGQLPGLTVRVVPIIPSGDHGRILKDFSRAIERQLESLEDWSWGSSIKHKGVLPYITMLDRLSVAPSGAGKYIPKELLNTEKYSPADTKLDEAIAIANGIVDSGDNCVLFCRYISGCEILHSKLYKSFILTGKTSNKQDVLDKYNIACKDGGAVLVCSDVGGESVNLPLTKYIVNVDVPWGDSDFIQRSSRGRRADSEYEVCFVLQLVIPGFDEYKLELCKWKGVFSGIVIDGVSDSSLRPEFRKYLTSNEFIGEFINGDQKAYPARDG